MFKAVFNMHIYVSWYTLFCVCIAINEGPTTTIAFPGQTIELTCAVSGASPFRIINEVQYTLNQLFNGQLPGYNSSGNNLLVLNIELNDVRNGTMFSCGITQTPPIPDIISDPPAVLIVAGKYTLKSLLN